METQHTEIPMLPAILPYSACCGENWWYVKDANNNVIASRIMGRETAELIVKACNNHDKLVTSLNQLRNELQVIITSKNITPQGITNRRLANANKLLSQLKDSE